MCNHAISKMTQLLRFIRRICANLKPHQVNVRAWKAGHFASVANLPEGEKHHAPTWKSNATMCMNICIYIYTHSTITYTSNADVNTITSVVYIHIYIHTHTQLAYVFNDTQIHKALLSNGPSQPCPSLPIACQAPHQGSSRQRTPRKWGSPEHVQNQCFNFNIVCRISNTCEKFVTCFKNTCNVTIMTKCPQMCTWACDLASKSSYGTESTI